MLEVKDKWVMVTGASRGIGRQIALALGSLGCNLLLHSRSVGHTTALVEELNEVGGRVVALEADLSDGAQVERLLDMIDDASPRVDILFNNAAIMTPYHENVWKIPDQDFKNSFEVNVTSPIRLCNALVPPMIERRWGRVINLVSGIANEPGLAPYAVTKAALRKYTQDIIPVLAGTGVGMNMLDPGWLRTDMGSQQAPDPVESVVPGALVPALIQSSISGVEFSAQAYAGMHLEAALEKAESALSARA